MLVRLIYASYCTKVMEDADLEDILKTSHRKNTERQISGLLCHGNFRFIQCLEGTRTSINTLYAEIMADPKHTNLVLLDYQYIDHRLFADWQMAFVSALDMEAAQLINDVSQNSEFKPEELNAEQAIKLITGLKYQQSGGFSNCGLLQ